MTIEPLSASRVLDGIVIAGGLVVAVLVLLLGARAIITGKATGSVMWARMPDDPGDADRGTLERLQARADEARRLAAEQKSKSKSGRMRPSA